MANYGARHSLHLPSSRLSIREREAVYLAAKGYTNAEAGKKMGITKGTVKCHLTSARIKLGVRNRIELVMSFLGLREVI